MTPQQIDRWLLNHVFCRSRIFQVSLADCIDEFGNSFGADGTHFFVRALAKGEREETVFAYLKDYYARNPLRSFNEVLGADIGHPAGESYFCPWEEGRVRPLSKFSRSHKVGPTPDEALKPIIGRLLSVLASIKTRGFRQASVVDGFPRVIALVNLSGQKRYIVRDGQHRAAVMSHLGRQSMRVTYNADHWTPSWLYRFVSRLTGRGISFDKDQLLREVREDAVDSWPHVRDGTVTREQALTYFRAMFGAEKTADLSSMEAQL